MTESRKATETTRLYPDTKKRLEKLARLRGMDMSALMEELVPKVGPRAHGKCRNCEKEMMNPLGRHKDHEAWCVLRK